MDKLIAIENEDKYTFNKIEDLVKKIMGEDFYELDKEQKQKKIKFRVKLNLLNEDIPVIYYEKQKGNYNENAYIINDEITFILSLLKFNKFILLEEKDANIFGKYIQGNIIEKEDYFIVNNFANEILRKYLNIK